MLERYFTSLIRKKFNFQGFLQTITVVMDPRWVLFPIYAALIDIQFDNAYKLYPVKQSKYLYIGKYIEDRYISEIELTSTTRRLLHVTSLRTAEHKLFQQWQ
jgi:hypothetical protein